MTREEAILILRGFKEFYDSILWNSIYAERSRAIDMAIEALQREDNFLKSLETNEPLYTDVVRCKDCRWYDNRYGDVCHNPRYGDGHANYQPPYVDEDYWCKDGERKGGDDK